ncbi:unnamed protein product [Didymodactylos carnosus]|uniref:Uncharacterized protein n=1 Tax=Didymodactylos carnosus TaxID=1234261 RepID=A0A8S2GPL2_9BILA|nr:unnamed protein product [Didymodactylos carnosus]CAF3535243.1 unnamed protein product [Didymodactylos carnosus]
MWSIDGLQDRGFRVKTTLAYRSYTVKDESSTSDNILSWCQTDGEIVSSAPLDRIKLDETWQSCCGYSPRTYIYSNDPRFKGTKYYHDRVKRISYGRFTSVGDWSWSIQIETNKQDLCKLDWIKVWARHRGQTNNIDSVQNVERVYYQFSSDEQIDFVILKLFKPFKFDSLNQPVCLPSSFQNKLAVDLIRQTQICIQTGYGHKYHDNDRRQTDVERYSESDLEVAIENLQFSSIKHMFNVLPFKNNVLVNREDFKAFHDKSLDDLNKYRDKLQIPRIQHGDYGAPLMCLSEVNGRQKWVQYGITGSAEEIYFHSRPQTKFRSLVGRITNVTYILDKIREVMRLTNNEMNSNSLKLS